jgi:hypothetical protein
MIVECAVYRMILATDVCCFLWDHKKQPMLGCNPHPAVLHQAGSCSAGKLNQCFLHRAIVYAIQRVTDHLQMAVALNHEVERTPQNLACDFNSFLDTPQTVSLHHTQLGRLLLVCCADNDEQEPFPLL